MPRIRIDQSNEIVQSRGENTVRIDVVVISFQFSTFVSLMQLISHRRLGISSLRGFIEKEKPVEYHRLFL